MNSTEIAKKVFEIEVEGIQSMSAQLTNDLEVLVNDVLRCSGKLIVSGMGKSGIIGQKISATLSSTGTPSFYMHPGEAYHGDLGMIAKDDMLLLISNSGETDEILKLIPYLKDNGNMFAAMTGNTISTLAKNAKYHLNVKIEKEACPLQLAPTSSTTAALVMGDALAVALMKKRGFKPENFARFHPGGSLGRRLLTTVADVMRTDNLPLSYKQADIKTIIHIITNGRCGICVIQDESGISGVVTDGDVRRAMENREDKFFTLTADDLMTDNPVIISSELNVTDAERIMIDNKINTLLIADDNYLKGIVQIYDLGVS